jgi:hypothetical protein
MNHPIDLVTGKKYRIYLVNMLEFDLVKIVFMCMAPCLNIILQALQKNHSKYMIS